MKYVISFLLVCIFICSCKKNSEGNSNNGTADPMEGRFIIRTEPLCSDAKYVGQKLAGNLVDHQFALTNSDTLNSWYTKKYGTHYIIYAKKGFSFLIWRQAPPITLNIGEVYPLYLDQVNSLPSSVASEMLFSFTDKGGGSLHNS